MTTISGKWVFHKNITYLDCFVSVNFISNGESFNRFSFYKEDINLAFKYCLDYIEEAPDGAVYPCPVYSSDDSWTEAYRTVDFGEEPQEVPEAFRSFMEKNATEVDAAQNSSRGFKDGSSFVCPILDPITFINNDLRSYMRFYVRLSDLPEEVIE